MKLIHCADIHLDSKLSANLDGDKRKKRRNELLDSFINMVLWAANNAIDGIIIAGDLFDTSDISKTTASLVRKCISDNPQIDFYYLKGNHDVHSFLYGMEKEYTNLKLFGEEWTQYVLGEKKNIVLSGVELTKDNSEAVYNTLLLDPGKYNIVTLHGQNSKYQAKDKTEVVNVSGLKNKSIDFLALGHVHRFIEEKLDNRGVLCYCGCLEGRGFDECGVHGFVELTIDEESLEVSRRFVPWGKRVLFEIESDISECMNSKDAVYAIRKVIASQGATSKDMVKVVLKGYLDPDAEINSEYILHELEDEFFYVKLKDCTRLRLDISRYAYDASLKGEFVRLVMSDTSLDEERKSEIIRTGLLALMGEEF